MTVDEVYRLCQYVVNKSQNGYFSPDEFNLVINQAQVMYQDFLLGEVQSYQSGRPIPRVQFGMNETVRQKLTPFIDTPVALTIDVTGFSPYPINYQEIDAVYTSTMDMVRYVQQDALYSYLNSVIDPVATNPIYLIRKAGLQFYPTTITGVTLSYIQTPPDIVWASTPDVNGRLVYNPGASTDPIWYDVDMMDIITRALRMIGVNLEDGSVIQYATEIKNAGQ